MLRFAPLMLAASIVCAGAVLAKVPQNMNVQGRLTDVSGNPVSAGLKNFTFRIFDQEIGGVEVWPGGPGETQALNTDANGLWNARVGAVLGLTDATFADSSRWLQVTVDDGVNPPETLSRIKLNKGPYTSDQYVDASGDLMTGGLRNFAPRKDIGSNIDVQNNNDTYTPYWSNGQGTWGIQSEAQSDNALWNIGVAGAAKGNNNLVLPNIGVMGAARGTGTENIGVHGETGMNGTANYSGFFENGDFIVIQPFTSGTEAVQLPLNAIDNTEILDESGVAASATAGGSFAVGTSYVVLNSTSVGLPSPGYVVVIAEATFNANTPSTYLFYRIRENGVTVLESDAWDAGDVDGFYDQHQSIVYTGVVPQGAYTYDFSVKQNLGTVDVVLPKVTVMYFPTTYGVVAPTIVTEANGFAKNVNDPRSALVPGTRPFEVEIERSASMAASEARIDNEMAAMRARIEQIEAQFHKRNLSPTRGENAELAPER